jgi:hypothetical protein
MGKTKRRDVLECISQELELTINRDEVRELEDKLYTDYDDFYIELDGEEYRFIHEDFIWDIYVDSIKEMVEDCYDIKAPDWLAIDWEETANNCYVDGYGHHFAHYDSNEYEHTIDDALYYIFRLN